MSLFSPAWIEKFDAARGIPRKANEQYLPAYQAFWAWAMDLGAAVFFIFLGLAGAFLSFMAGYLLNVSGMIWLVFWSLALISLVAGSLDAYLLCWSYRLWTMSTSHGSARWARLQDLIARRLVSPVKDEPLPPNSLPLAKVFGGRDLYLPKEQWLRHFVMFGPTGSGKSKTFFMAMLRSILEGASTLVYDPKGELYEQTGGFAEQVYRLDLNNPERSDRWNFFQLCRENPAIACQIAGMMLGSESRQKTSQDPFWGEAEQLALTAILLHLAFIYGSEAIPAFAADFLIGLGGQEDAFAAELETSPSFFAKQAFFAFRRSPPQTHGSVLIGLYNKLRPFTLAPTRAVTTLPTAAETERGCRIIDFSELRRKGTAIYLVVSEGAAEIYKEFLATFLGQAVLEMRLDGINEPEVPCFVLIDEAYQLNVSEVKRISGIGRGRGVGLGLGYQDLPQMYDQYGKEQANAILGTVLTKIFLPGLDDVTAEYASKQFGETTVYGRTFQDFPGKKNDNVRYAEQKRALMHGSEVRQIAAHGELLILCDTAPPIKAAYPPLAVLKNKFLPATYGQPRSPHLGDIDEKFRITGSENPLGPLHEKASGENEGNTKNPFETENPERLSDTVGEAVSEIITEDAIPPAGEPDEANANFEEPLKPGEDIASRITSNSIQKSRGLKEKNKARVRLSKTVNSEGKLGKPESDSGETEDALSDFVDDVRRQEHKIYQQSLMNMHQSMV